MRVMVEIAPSANFDLNNIDALAKQMQELGFNLDPDLDPVPLGEQGHGPLRRPTSLILSGTVADSAALDALKHRADVLHVWSDTEIAPFSP